MRNLNTLLDQHVTLAYEFVDRVFLNGYVAKLQDPDQLAWFLCQHRGEEIPRYELLGKMTRDLVAAIEQMAEDRHIPVIHFEKGQRKETVAEPYFAQARGFDTPGWPHFDTLVGPTRAPGGRGRAHRTGRGVAASCTGDSEGPGDVRSRVLLDLAGATTAAVGLLTALVRAGEAGPADGGLGPGVEAADGTDDPGHRFEVAGAWTSRHRFPDQVP